MAIELAEPVSASGTSTSARLRVQERDRAGTSATVPVHPPATESARSNDRIASLDGWRGIAILLVLVDHIAVGLNGGYPSPWFQVGQHGVTIFFVLSGFLITSRLLDGPIDLKQFYIRRVFRLMPVAWACLCALLIFGMLTHTRDIFLQEVVACVFFYRNFIGPVSGSGIAGHFWSLSLEEQFYLVWPGLLFLGGIRRARSIALAGALACALFRFTHWAQYDRIWLSFQSEVRADALLLGCLLALLLRDPAMRLIAARWSKFLILPSLCVFVFCIRRFHWLPPLYECAAITCLIASSTLHVKSLLARALSLPLLTWLGRVSYSVYVWQQFFLWHRARPIAVTMFCLMPVFALGSYYCIERPCTRFGHWLTRATG